MSDPLSTGADTLGASTAYQPALMGTRHMASPVTIPQRMQRSLCWRLVATRLMPVWQRVLPSASCSRTSCR